MYGIFAFWLLKEALIHEETRGMCRFRAIMHGVCTCIRLPLGLLFWLKLFHTTQTHDKHKKIYRRIRMRKKHTHTHSNSPVRCSLGERGWEGLIHLGTSWEPQQDLWGRRRIIYSNASINFSFTFLSWVGDTYTEGGAVLVYSPSIYIFTSIVT